MSKPYQPRFTRRWYGDHIPPYYSARFPRFLGSSVILARHAAWPAGVKKIVFTNEPEEVQPEIDEGVIQLPVFALLPDFYDAMLGRRAVGDLAATVVATLAGVAVQQATRLRVSPTTSELWSFPEVMGRAGGEVWGALELFHQVHRLMEDVYADEQARARPYGGFIDEMLPIFFSESLFAFVSQAGIQNFHDITTLLEFWRNPGLRDHPLWSDPFMACCLEIVARAANENSQRARVQLAVELIKLFRQQFEQSELEGEGEGEGEDSHHHAPGGACPACGQPSPLLDKMNHTPPEDGPSPRQRRDGKRLYAKRANAAEQKARAQYLEEVENATSSAWNQNDESRDEATVERVDASDFPLPHHKNALRPNRDFDDFARYLNQIRSRRSVPGAPRDLGTTIVNPRLWRVADDQKIFAPPRRLDLNRDKEIIFLLDLSGSMKSSQLVEPVLEATMGAFESLMGDHQAHVTIYGHTTDYSSRERAQLVHIASWNMRGRRDLDWQARFNRALNVPNRNNLDGYAIAAAAESFTASPRARRLMLVLSDGQPSGSSYGGPSAMEHTRNAALRLRARGIAIVALSLVKAVVAQNNAIYGEAFNARAIGPELPGEIMRVIDSAFNV